MVTDEGHRGADWPGDWSLRPRRQVIANGAIPTYLHDHRNLASAHVADAAGFPDRGWLVLALWDT